MDIDKFNKAITEAKGIEKTTTIGTLSEKILHRTLKYYFESDRNYHEVKIGTYYADICVNNNIYEIQTRQFNKLREKLKYFLEEHKVTIVYPIFPVKWLIWYNKETGEITNRRKSPYKGNIFNAINELYKIKFLLNNANLLICLIFIEIEEYKNLDGWNKTKKRGSSRLKQVPLKLYNELWIHTVDDYNIFIPNELDKVFTVRNYQTITKLSLYQSQLAINVLKYLKLIQQVGKDGKAYQYSRIKDI